jgi:hypothetical protein
MDGLGIFDLLHESVYANSAHKQTTLCAQLRNSQYKTSDSATYQAVFDCCWGMIPDQGLPTKIISKPAHNADPSEIDLVVSQTHYTYFSVSFLSKRMHCF